MPRKVLSYSLVLLVSCAAAAVASTSTAPNPLVSFDTPGSKQVSLQVCNTGGCSTVIHWVTVLDPLPLVTSFIATPTPIFQGEVVHLSGFGSGAPPLTYGWRILDMLGTTVASLSGSSADWTTNVSPGIYTVYFDLSNTWGVDTPPPALVTVLTSAFLFSDGFEAGSTAAWAGP